MSRKTHSFGHAEQIISNYPANIAALARERNAVLQATPAKPEVQIQGKGRVGDPTSVKALLLYDPRIMHLTEAVLAVQRALEDFQDDVRFEQMKTIIDLYYWQGTHTIKGAAKEAWYSERQARKLKGRFVCRVAQYLGWL